MIFIYFLPDPLLHYLYELLSRLLLAHLIKVCPFLLLSISENSINSIPHSRAQVTFMVWPLHPPPALRSCPELQLQPVNLRQSMPAYLPTLICIPPAKQNAFSFCLPPAFLFILPDSVQRDLFEAASLTSLPCSCVD